MSGKTDFVCIDEPATGQDVVLIHAALSGSDIVYHIENENHSVFTDGVAGVCDARMRLMVDPARAEEARKLIKKIRGS